MSACSSKSANKSGMLANPSAGSRNCFYCHEMVHAIANCPVLKWKQTEQQMEIKKVKAADVSQIASKSHCLTEPVFKSFVSSG